MPDVAAIRSQRVRRAVAAVSDSLTQSRRLSRTVTEETLSASLENYLEAIYHIVARKQAARPKDIADEMGVNNSSVTGALRALAARGLVNYAPFDVVTLTHEGRGLAENIVRRHEILRDFFTRVLCVDAEEADRTACEMEHFISPHLLERFLNFVEFIQICPRAGADWMEKFLAQCSEGPRAENCADCLRDLAGNAPASGVTVPGRSAHATPVPLSRLDVGGTGVVAAIEDGPAVHNPKLAEMGVAPGSLVEREKTEMASGVNDSVRVRVRGYHLELRRDEAAGILVIPLPAPGKTDG